MNTKSLKSNNYSKVWRIIRNVACNQQVRRFSKFASSLVEIYFYVDRDNPVSYGAGLFSLVNAGMEAFEIDELNRIEQYVSDRGLVEHGHSLAKVLYSAGIMKDQRPEVVVAQEHSTLEKVHFDYGDLYFVRHTDESFYYENERDSFMPYHYVAPGFPFEKLFEELWKRYPDGLFIPAPKTDDAVPGLGDFDFEFLPLAGVDTTYLGDAPDLGQMVDDYKKFREKNISRSYLFCGIPGVGKTSFSIAMAKQFSNRIIKLSPESVDMLSASNLEFLICNLQPDFLVFDDFDRVGSQERLLFAIENVKQKAPTVTIFATVNDFDSLDKALVRPGRFDSVVWFNAPSSESRRKILTHYADKFNLTLTKKQLDALVAQTEDITGAYLREMCLRLSIQGFDRLPGILAEFKRTLAEQE